MDWLTKIEILGAFASIVGVVLGIPALTVGFVQLLRTKKAAEAAADSAKEAVQRVSRVAAVAAIEQVCSRSRDLLQLVRGRNHSASATAAFELREAIAKLCRSSVASQLLQETEWSKFLKSVSEVHDALERAAGINKMDAASRDGLLQRISDLHSKLSMLTTVAGEKAGGSNANTIQLS
jgi:predicted RNA-binding Zn ribbon-like protein